MDKSKCAKTISLIKGAMAELKTTTEEHLCDDDDRVFFLYRQQAVCLTVRRRRNVIRRFEVFTGKINTRFVYRNDWWVFHNDDDLKNKFKNSSTLSALLVITLWIPLSVDQAKLGRKLMRKQEAIDHQGEES